jgi:hypothetical protein
MLRQKVVNIALYYYHCFKIKLIKMGVKRNVRRKGA